MATTPIFQWISGFSFMPNWFNDLTASTYFASIMFGLGAINLAKNPDGLFALIGAQRAERRRRKERAVHIEAAEEELHGAPAKTRVLAEMLPVGANGSSEPAGAPLTLASPPGPDSGLTIEGIVAGYDDVEVLHAVSLQVGQGSVVALVGANGAGKSTLCATVAGLVMPTSGRILVGERDVTALASHERARSGVMLAPEARGVFPGLTVEENLEVLLRTPAQRQQAYERFPILGARRKQTAGLLSGGEQQMLSLAPALAEPPAVFVADEPTLGLAPMAAEAVIGAVAELRDLGCAVLLVEEKAREVLEVADTVAFMELGRVAWVGPRADIDEERLAATYLGTVTT
jgi:ABC-type branched-subunit amino acid transport system ATPase component